MIAAPKTVPIDHNAGSQLPDPSMPSCMIRLPIPQDRTVIRRVFREDCAGSGKWFRRRIPRGIGDPGSPRLRRETTVCYTASLNFAPRGPILMSVDPAPVRRIAHLARIAVTEAEVPHLQGELNAMLAFVEQLSEVDVEGVEPMTSVTPMEMQKGTDVIA